MKRVCVYWVLFPVLCACSARNQRNSPQYDDIPIRMMKLLEAAERERDLSKYRWCSISDLTDQLAVIKEEMARGAPIENVEKQVSAAERFAAAYELQYQMSENLEAYNSLDVVIRLYTEAIELHSGYAEAYDNRGEAYHLQRDFDQAILYYSKAIELSWGFAIAWTNRGDAYMSKGEISEGMWDFNVACQLGYQPACKELHALER